MITELTGKYRFLSNFWSCFVVYEGVTYPSVENAYQAAKCAVPEDRPRFLYIKASEAKKLGRVIKMRSDWDKEKLSVMYDLLKQKFQNEILRNYLLNTKDEEIEEGNWWGDYYWGTVNGVGNNNLGKLIMMVRKELREEACQSLLATK